MNGVSWGEFFFIVKRQIGAVKAAEALHLLEQLPIELVAVDLPLVREAAEIKSEYAVSYADAFWIATTRRLAATVLTSDPEFHAVEHLITVRWLTG